MMELLHQDLQAISLDLSGATVVAQGREYVFSAFYLDAERIPPVAEGYVLHLRLMVAVWRWERYQDADGNGRWHQARYAFRPDEVSFVADKTLPEMPIGETTDGTA